MESVKIKVFLGYFMLVVMASLIIWVIFSEILQYSKEKVDFNPGNNKFIYISNILTNLYQSEGLERNYSQSGQIAHYQDYLDMMNTISLQIDTLALMLNDPIQKIHTDSIKKLLKLKQKNLKELSAIKKTNTSSAIFQKGMKKIPSVKDSIGNLSKVYVINVAPIDSIDGKKEKKNLFEKLTNVFKSKKKTKSNFKEIKEAYVKKDSLIDEINAADSISGFIETMMTEIRDEGAELEKLLKQKEREILANDRTISLQLQQMLSDIEKEELKSSFERVQNQQARIGKATEQIILVGLIALVIIISFLVNILKDITKSQRYRQDLEVAKDYTESLLKSKEQFMLSLTHDLKSPLNSIIGFTGFMEEDQAITHRHRKYLQHIHSASAHILKLVNDLLDLARLDTGKLSIDRIPFDFKKLISEMVAGFGPQAQAKKIDLQLKFIQSPSVLYQGDPARITQILSNLISNALNFTDEGSLTVKVSIVDTSENKDQVQVEVIDTGIGISEENIQRIFEEFTRVETTKKQYEGTGLGLTITKKIIDLLQGTLNLKSKPGEGSIFTVSLPLERGEMLSVNVPELGQEKSKQQVLTISGLKIWLIDDDQTLLEMTTILLKSAGAEVHSFYNPLKAVDAFRKGSADLLITDIQMPEMSGIELLNRIQEKNEGPVTSIAVSGQILEKEQSDWFNTYIQKPYQANKLIDVILNLQPEVNVSREFDEVENVIRKGYNLDQITAFTDGDKESLNQILVSFVDTSRQNLKLFKESLKKENTAKIVELSHKMLPIFRQLEVSDIVDLLAQLEQKEFTSLNDKLFLMLSQLTIEKVDAFLLVLVKEENLIV